ncbi:hypothetical protein FCM35_KLT06068 [Carex littledalei]|uniref:Uncharacterized protein n=1 Tax=Carex littledalei TaxID=544730 RepID=A0A833QM33_9POAL|nr:hypothetical protein FCM35_KLT06068 [Carex littledalei]
MPSIFLLFLLTLISIRLPGITADCVFPCQTPPQTPNYPSPSTPYNYPSPPLPVNPYTPPYWNYPPSSGYIPNYQSPSGGFMYSSPPPPNPIVPWYPWYSHPPSSGSAGLLPPLLISVLLGCLMTVIVI